LSGIIFQYRATPIVDEAHTLPFQRDFSISKIRTFCNLVPQIDAWLRERSAVNDLIARQMQILNALARICFSENTKNDWKSIKELYTI
jgi:hypothetical protein